MPYRWLAPIRITNRTPKRNRFKVRIWIRTSQGSTFGTLVAIFIGGRKGPHRTVPYRTVPYRTVLHSKMEGNHFLILVDAFELNNYSATTVMALYKKPLTWERKQLSKPPKTKEYPKHVKTPLKFRKIAYPFAPLAVSYTAPKLYSATTVMFDAMRFSWSHVVTIVVITLSSVHGSCSGLDYVPLSFHR